LCICVIIINFRDNFMAQTVLVICGGKSVEHEISLLSAEFVVKTLLAMHYKVEVIFIDNAGLWYLQKNSLSDTTNKGYIVPVESGVAFVNALTKDLEYLDIDLVFPIMHGYFGEDGIVQGIVASLNLPCVGPSVLSAAVTFDKDITKRLLKDAGIKVVDYEVIYKLEQIPLEKIEANFGYPCFVKPAQSGSSIGIFKAKNRQELVAAIGAAFQYDLKVIVERFVSAREIECGVIGNVDAVVSLPGELITDHEFYTFNAKYLQTENLKIKLADNLSTETLAAIQELAAKAFRTLSCRGMARVDFFVTTKDIFINEINAVPGFTKDSMFPKIWEMSGVPVIELFERLMQYAQDVFNKEQALLRARVIK
jgi:D-alanine-D-alanine ligase